MITRLARIQKRLESNSSRFDRFRIDTTVMDESPRRVQRPGRPGEESGVLEFPSLTDQMNVTMDVEGEVSGNLEAVRLID
jgi:hypothetical protein